jgi:hypothetical protein
LDDLELKDDPIEDQRPTFHSAFPILNKKGMPWDKLSSSDEENDGVDENLSTLHLSDIDDVSLHLGHQLLLHSQWTGRLTMSIPMVGIEKLIGGVYTMNLTETKDGSFIGTNTYDEMITQVILTCIRGKNALECNFHNSDGIYFNGILDLKKRILKGKCSNSDTPQGHGQFELKAMERE